jgi:hypothetical protein
MERNFFWSLFDASRICIWRWHKLVALHDIEDVAVNDLPPFGLGKI